MGRISNPEKEILLDVLFAENPYPALVEKPIASDWVLIEGEPMTVQIPCVNSIAGDKMVAYAPNTTGVPYGVEKEREIIKQLCDVGNLFDLIEDPAILKASYIASATGEMKYRADRGITSIDEILQDTINTSLILAKGQHHAKDDEDSRIKFAALNKRLKFVERGEALFYWHETLTLLHAGNAQ